jgi:HTH-type transcriptional regulator / antitoxin HigA
MGASAQVEEGPNMTESMPKRSDAATAIVRPIRTEADYEKALFEIDRLFAAVPGTEEADRLEVLTTLVERYERQHHPVLPPDPIGALLYHMESRGLTRHDLEPYLGSRARVAEILNRRRGLTIEMIRRLHQGLGLPAEILIQPYALRREAV